MPLNYGGLVACLLSLVLGGAPTKPAAGAAADTWVGTWAASPQLVEEANLPPAPAFGDTTLRQVVRVSIAGTTLRVRFSNGFGQTGLTLAAARVARSAGRGAIQPGTDRALTFGGRSSVTVPAGAFVVSDALHFDLPALSDLAVTIHVRGAPAGVTGHPGSRTTSFFQAGDAVSSSELPSAIRVEHWYFLSGIDVMAGADAAAVAVLGDSITDGRGSTTDGHDRWPDHLARRLHGSRTTAQVAVLNHGIGGNRLLRDGLGPSALARLDRDILAQPGVRWLIVFEGINDIGTGSTARDIISSYEQIIERAHQHDILVYGATIMAFEGFSYANYYTPEREAVRQRVNEWIRTSGRFDRVIDFDAATRDPKYPSRLSAAVDGGDHLHPSAAGYRIMADAVDLALFVPPRRGR